MRAPAGSLQLSRPALAKPTQLVGGNPDIAQGTRARDIAQGTRARAPSCTAQEGDNPMMRERTKAEQMIADMEDDLRAARDYACILFNRLGMSPHPIDEAGQRARARAACELWDRIQASEHAYDALFKEVIRKDEPLLDQGWRRLRPVSV
jgi:hypothetical protein